MMMCLPAVAQTLTQPSNPYTSGSNSGNPSNGKINMQQRYELNNDVYLPQNTNSNAFIYLFTVTDLCHVKW